MPEGLVSADSIGQRRVQTTEVYDATVLAKSAAPAGEIGVLAFSSAAGCPARSLRCRA